MSSGPTMSFRRAIARIIAGSSLSMNLLAVSIVSDEISVEREFNVRSKDGRRLPTHSSSTGENPSLAHTYLPSPTAKMVTPRNSRSDASATVFLMIALAIPFRRCARPTNVPSQCISPAARLIVRFILHSVSPSGALQPTSPIPILWPLSSRSASAFPGRPRANRST